VLPYLDIPLQHISKPILKRMGRKLSKEPFMEWLENLKKTIPELALRTTFIVGFPGETEEQFNELLHFIENSNFFHIGAFPYSKEKGTKAFSYKNDINRRVVERRLRKLYNLSHTITINNKKQLIGQTSEVIIERISDDKIYGRAWFQTPDIDGDAIIRDKGNTNHNIGDIINCSLEEVSGHRLIFKTLQ
jgi:ribosomal protein S12 methylthiotransferase